MCIEFIQNGQNALNTYNYKVQQKFTTVFKVNV